MGEVIVKTAAVEDILRDVLLTLSAAEARGGEWALDAKRFLAVIHGLAQEVTTELDEARDAIPALQAAVDARDDEADDLLAGIYDVIFNLLGRPGNDPLLTIIFPGGSSAYTQGPDDEQPDRMELLAQVLSRNVHPGIPPAEAAAMVFKINAAASALREAVQAARKPKIRASHLASLRQVLARSSQVQLVRLKRFWKADGRSEADIHQVIPDRPRSARAKGKPEEPVSVDE
jgi:hypothetical protein